MLKLKLNRFVFILLIEWMLSLSLMAQETITVAITPSSPWVMFDVMAPPESRTPSGFNIDMWTAIADELNMKTDWLYQDSTAAVFQAVKAEKADVGLVNFPPSTVKLGLQVMILAEQNMWQVIIKSIKNLTEQMSLGILLAPLLFFLGAANVRWLLDRLNHREYRRFPRNYFTGVYEAGWWNFSLIMDWDGSARGLSRTFDLFWHLLGVLLLSGFVGLLTASFTLQSVNEQIKKVEDIDNKKVAVLEDTAYVQRYVQQHYQATKLVVVDNIDEAIKLLLDLEVSAVIHHGTELERLAKQMNKNSDEAKVRLLNQVVNRQHYAIVVADNHPQVGSFSEQLARFDQPQGLEESFAKRLSAKWNMPFNQ